MFFSIMQIKEGAGRYILRAVKHFVKLTVLIALVFAIMYATKTLAITPNELLGTRGLILLVALVVLSAAYPAYGFSSASARASVEDDRRQIIEALSMGGYSLVEEREGEMLFRTTSPLKRLTQMGDDAIVVRSAERGNVTICGVRKEVENARFRIEGCIHRDKNQ